MQDPQCPNAKHPPGPLDFLFDDLDPEPNPKDPNIQQDAEFIFDLVQRNILPLEDALRLVIQEQ